MNNDGMFLLFAGDECYPAGGFSDHIASFESAESAKEFYLSDEFLKFTDGHFEDRDWAHIVSWEKKEIVSYFKKGKWIDC